MDWQNWQTPLLVTAIVFAAFMVFRFRPVISVDGRVSAAALKEAKKKIVAAKDDAARAAALCDAADASVKLGRISSAVTFYLRALRAAPGSREIASRAASGLARRHAALEKVMWRQLANAHFGESPESREAAVVALRALSASYAKRPRFHPRSRAIENILEALGEKPSPRASQHAPPPSRD